MNRELKTHEVLDLHYLPEEGQGCFVGTLKECEDFIGTQSPHFMYQVVPMTKEEIENYPDNQFKMTINNHTFLIASLKEIDMPYMHSSAYLHSLNYDRYKMKLKHWEKKNRKQLKKQKKWDELKLEEIERRLDAIESDLLIQQFLS